jgi:aspartyl-tRNA(Asn)/glutamyl-tRNA(Gln) amidotransferase subunit A
MSGEGEGRGGGGADDAGGPVGLPGFPPVAAMARAVSDRDVAPHHWLQQAEARMAAEEEGERPLNAFLARGEMRYRGDSPPGSPAAHPSGAATKLAAAGDATPGNASLAGVPVAVKDNLATLGLPTTCASRILEGYRSPFEATVVRRLQAAGGVVAGKTNMDEFGMGSSTENSAFGVTRNPADRGRVPGGSSGGSAAAVAAGLVPLALGSDTGGSVRQPAALCGAVGIKPTYGRVSRYGLVAFASSLDQVGTFGARVEDAALLLQVIAGHDPFDATSADRPVEDLAVAARAGAEAAGEGAAGAGRAGGSAEGAGGPRAGLQGKVIGVPEEYLPETLDPAVRARFDQAVEALRAGGAEVRRISLPHTRFAVPTYYILAPAEASSNLARYDGIRYGVRAPEARTTVDLYRETRTRGFGPEVVRRIMLGTYALSAGYYEAYYGRAQKVRALIAGDFRRVFRDGAGAGTGTGTGTGGGGPVGRRAEGVDLVFTPTTPAPAFGLGERVTDPVSMYLSDIFTVTANLAGIPGLSLPIGRVDGLPVGGQLLAPWWGEVAMVEAAAGLEAVLAETGAWATGAWATGGREASGRGTGGREARP